MKRWITIGWTGAAAALIVAILAPAGSTATVKKVAFTGNYSGTANVQVNGSVANISANGTGTGTTLGAGSISGTGTGDSTQQPCVPFAGPGTITGPGGKLIFTVPQGAQGCGDEQGQVFAVVGHGDGQVDQVARRASGEYGGVSAGLAPALLCSSDGHPPAFARSPARTRGQCRRGQLVSWQCTTPPRMASMCLLVASYHPTNARLRVVANAIAGRAAPWG